MRTLLMMLLSFSLLACGSDAAQEGTEGDVGQAPAAPAETGASPIEDASLVSPDYKPAFPQVEVKKWFLTEYVYDGRSVKMGKEDLPMITIANGKISGHSGCNKFSSTITLQEDGTLNIGEIASTKMLCQGKMTQESRFFDLLKSANAYSVNKVFLEISGGQGQLSFRAEYKPQPDNAE
jgi:heat shock protein HslJ